MSCRQVLEMGASPALASLHFLPNVNATVERRRGSEPGLWLPFLIHSPLLPGSFPGLLPGCLGLPALPHCCVHASRRICTDTSISSASHRACCTFAE